MKKSSSVVTEELLEFIYGGCFAQGSLRFHHSFHLRLFMAWILVLSSHTSMNSLSDSRVDLGFYATRMVLSRAKLRNSLWSFSTKLQFWVHLVELSVSLRVIKRRYASRGQNANQPYPLLPAVEPPFVIPPGDIVDIGEGYRSEENGFWK